MSVVPTTQPDHEATLDEILDTWLAAEETGRPMDRREMLERYPLWAGELARFFDGHDRLSRLAAPLREIAQTGLAAGELDDAATGAIGGYDILDRLGEGGMGVVYKARQHVPSRMVAVKITRAGMHWHGADMQRFRNEAELIARLDHPGIVPIYEVGEDQGRLYFSMRLLEGGDLGRHLDLFMADPRAAAQVMAAVARAVHHAHQCGILHRDLKPSNIVLDSEGKPHVTDFGLARRFGLGDEETMLSLTQSGLFPGTPGYMAPEQASVSGRMLTTAADVYGLGGVLFALLTGRAPFQGGSAWETLLMARESEPPPPRRLNPQAPADLETICLKCLARDPARRYASAELVAEDLERWLSGRPIQARAPSAAERLWCYCRRQPVVAGLTLFAVVLLAAIIVGLAAAVVLLRGEQNRTELERGHAQRQAKLAQQREAAARRLLYVADINQAWRAHESADLGRMRRLLSRHIPAEDQEDLRGFEWRYLSHLARSADRFQAPGVLHAGQVFCVAVSPDGTRFATASEDRTVAVWDAATDGKMFELKGFTHHANWIVFTADGGTLLACGEDGSIWSCDAWTGEQAACIYQSPDGTAIPQIALSPDDATLAATSWDGMVRRFAWPSMEELPPLPHAPGNKAEGVRFSSDGRLMITGGRDHTAKVWDAATGELKHSLDAEGIVKSVAVAEGRPWAAAGSYDGQALVWDYETGQPLHRNVSHPTGIQCVAISPDGALLATADMVGGVRVWDLDTGRLLNAFPGDSSRVWSVAFTPDGASVLTSDSQGTVMRRPVVAGHLRRRLLHTEHEVRALTPLPSEQALVCLTVHQIHVLPLDATTENDRATLVQSTEHAVVLAAHAEKLFVGSYDGHTQAWERDGLAPLWSVKAHAGWSMPMALTLDGVSLLTGAVGDPIRLWDVKSGKLLEEIPMTPTGCISFALSHDGRLLAAAGHFGELLLIDFSTRAALRSLDCLGREMQLLAFSPDDTILAGSDRHHSIMVWDMREDSKPRFELKDTHRITSLAFSPDGRTLASATHNGMVRLWHLATGQELLALQGAERGTCVAFSPDGSRLFLGGCDGAMQGEVWVWEGPSDSSLDRE